MDGADAAVPVKPPAFDLQGVTENDLIDFTPELRAEAIKALEQLPHRSDLHAAVADRADGNKGTIVAAGSRRRRQLAVGAADPETGFVYVGSTTNPGVIGLTKNDRSARRPASTPTTRWAAALPTIQGLRILKPPYGRITAYNMNKGEIAWQIPNGDTPPEVKDNRGAEAGLTIPKTGSPSQAGLLVTKTLLFAGEGSGGQAVFHAYDKATGAESGRRRCRAADQPADDLPAPGPAVHRRRRVRGNGATVGAQLVAFALPPRERPAAAAAAAARSVR